MAEHTLHTDTSCPLSNSFLILHFFFFWDISEKSDPPIPCKFIFPPSLCLRIGRSFTPYSVNQLLKPALVDAQNSLLVEN